MRPEFFEKLPHTRRTEYKRDRKAAYKLPNGFRVVRRKRI